MTTTNTEANKALALAGIKGTFIDRDPSVLDRIFSHDYQHPNPRIPNGTAAIKAILSKFGPDFKYEPGLVIAEGDYVAINQWPMATDTIRLLRPNIFAKGSEYSDSSKDRTGAITAEERVVEEVGADVKSVKKGDRVVVPFNIACGHCYNCMRGFTSACLTVNAKTAGGAYGYVGMGPFRGASVPRAGASSLGVQDSRQLGFIVPVDADASNYYSTAISMTSLREAADLIPAKHIYFVMDSCYSGLALTRPSLKAVSSPSRCATKPCAASWKVMANSSGRIQTEMS